MVAKAVDAIYDQDEVKARTGITGRSYLGKLTIPAHALSGGASHAFHIFRADVDTIDGQETPHGSDLIWFYDAVPSVKGSRNRRPVPYSLTFISDGSLKSLIAMNGYDHATWSMEQTVRYISRCELLYVNEQFRCRAPRGKA